MEVSNPVKPLIILCVNSLTFSLTNSFIHPILVLLRRTYFDSLKQYPQKSEAFGLHQISDNLSSNTDRHREIKAGKTSSKGQALSILQTFYGTIVMIK